jgi:oxalate decarboxylase
MSEFSRRSVLGGAAAGSVLAATAEGRAQGQQPLSGPTPALLAGAELPSFRFALGAVTPKAYDGGWLRAATVDQFPVSQKLAGALMQLAPGGLRELHWHANAAEWAYVIKGRCRVTTIDPQNRSEVGDFGPGDVWYFPRGYGHSIQGIGGEDCLFVLVFDNGYFAEFGGTFSISDWLGHVPPGVLQKSLGVPAQRFANFPKREVFIARGPVPAALARDPAAGSPTAGMPTYRYPLLDQKPDEYPGGTSRLVSQREFPVSTTMTGSHIRIRPGAIRELHWHPNADEWQYYLAGRASMSVFGSHGRVRTEQFQAGDVGYVPEGYGHYIENIGTEDLDVIVVFNNGAYESISLSAWLATNPLALLATNFGVPQSTFDGFPTGARYIPR